MHISFHLHYQKGEFQFKNFVMLTIAGIINAVGITLLLAPVNLLDSGVSGIAMFLDMATHSIIPLWAWLVIINFPIFLFGMNRQGVAFTVYSLYAILVYSLAAAIFQQVIPAFVPDFFKDGSPIVGQELILCAIFGGILSGMGSGITIRYGGTMDGMETLAVIFAQKMGLTVGNFVMIFNVCLYIAVGAYFVGTGVDNAFILPLFSIIAYFANGKTTDFISQGLDQAKGALIITNKREEVGNALSEEFGRGLTVIDAQGFYSKQDKSVIYCVVNRFQVAKMRKVIVAIDKFAFVTIMDISDVLGTSIKYSRANDKKQEEKRKANKEQRKKLIEQLKITDIEEMEIAQNALEKEQKSPENEAKIAEKAAKNEHKLERTKEKLDKKLAKNREKLIENDEIIAEIEAENTAEAEQKKSKNTADEDDKWEDFS